jgi:hypothetical protein
MLQILPDAAFGIALMIAVVVLAERVARWLVAPPREPREVPSRAHAHGRRAHSSPR